MKALIGTTLILAAGGGYAWSQVAANSNTTFAFPMGSYQAGGFGGFGGPGFGWGNFGGGTAAGNAYTGWANVIQAQGAKNLADSQALSNLQDANSKYIDNRMKATQTFFEMRAVNKSYREANKAPRMTSEAAFRLARQGVPARLSSVQLDPVTGRINWPYLLMDDRYAAQRSELDKLFAERTVGSSSDFSLFGTIRTAGEAMLEALKKNIKDYPATEYLSGRNFLNSLIYEGSLPSA